MEACRHRNSTLYSKFPVKTLGNGCNVCWNKWHDNRRYISSWQHCNTQIMQLYSYRKLIFLIIQLFNLQTVSLSKKQTNITMLSQLNWQRYMSYTSHIFRLKTQLWIDDWMYYILCTKITAMTLGSICMTHLKYCMPWKVSRLKVLCGTLLQLKTKRLAHECTKQKVLYFYFFNFINKKCIWSTAKQYQFSCSLNSSLNQWTCFTSLCWVLNEKL